MRNLWIVIILGSLVFGRECRNYTIKKGDTLTTISKAMYGKGSLWSIIFERNKNKIKNPYQITIGEKIKIPCIKTIHQNPKREEIYKLKRGKGIKIDIVSTTHLHPFMENSSSHKNMLTDIVKEALNNIKDIKYSIEYIENRDIHPSLLKYGKYGLSIGWYKPISIKKDNSFIYSEPLFQTVIVLYRRKSDNRKIKNIKDIYGTKICRPKGWFTFDLESQGLIDGETITLITKTTPEACFNDLKDGKVDFVSLTSFIGDKTINKMELSRYIEPIRAISTVVNLTLISHKKNPNGKLYINKFNQGLKILRESGKLEAIQNKYLKKFYQNKID